MYHVYIIMFLAQDTSRYSQIPTDMHSMEMQIQADTYRYALPVGVHICMYLMHIIKFSGMKYR